jgi:RNA polymerase sigma-70 factor (ECF subfamily)
MIVAPRLRFVARIETVLLMPADLKSAYLQHSPDLARYVRRRVRDSHAVSDVVHDAFVRMAEQPGTKVNDVRSYLYRIARNLLLDQKKQDARRQTFPVPHEALFDVADEMPSPEEATDARLRLEYLQRLNYAEVARHLAISESSVQKHLAMAVLHITRRAG